MIQTKFLNHLYLFSSPCFLRKGSAPSHYETETGKNRNILNKMHKNNVLEREKIYVKKELKGKYPLVIAEYL